MYIAFPPARRLSHDEQANHAYATTVGGNFEAILAGENLSGPEDLCREMGLK